MAEDEDSLGIAYWQGYLRGRKEWRGLIDREEIREGIRAADPEGMDLCPWSFEEGVKFAEQKLKEKNT